MLSPYCVILFSSSYEIRFHSRLLSGVIGIIVVILWTLLASFSIFYLTKIRSKMNDKRVSEDMEKIDPLNPDALDGSSKCYSKQTTAETDRSSDRSLDGSKKSADLDMEIGLRQNLRSSLRRSGSQRDMNIRGSLRDSLRRSDGQGNLRASIQRSDSQGNLRGSMRDSLRRSDGQDNLRASMRRSDSRGNLRGSGNRGLRRSGNKDDLRGSGNNLRGSGNRGLRGSGKNELTVSFLESDAMADHDNNVPKQRKNNDLSKSLTALVNWDTVRDGDEEEGLHRSDGNLSIPQSKASNDNIGKLRRSTKKGSRENLAGLTGSVTNGNDSILRRSVNSADNLTGLRGSGTQGNDTLRRSGNKRSSEDLEKMRQLAVSPRSDKSRIGRRSLSQSMIAHDRKSPRSSTRGERPAMSRSVTRSLIVDNERPANHLRRSTGTQRSGNNLRSSTKGDGLSRSDNLRPDSRLRKSSIELRNHNNLRSSARSDRIAMSQSVRVSDASEGNSSADSNFGNLVRQASARRHERRLSSIEHTDKKDIEALKRNLIL